MRFCWCDQVSCGENGNPGMSLPVVSEAAVTCSHYQSAGTFPTGSFIAQKYDLMFRLQRVALAATLRYTVDKRIPRFCRADNLDLAVTRWAPYGKLGYPVQPGHAHPFPGIAPKEIFYEVQVISVTRKAGDCLSMAIYTKKTEKWQGESNIHSAQETQISQYLRLVTTS